MDGPAADSPAVDTAPARPRPAGPGPLAPESAAFAPFGPGPFPVDDLAAGESVAAAPVRPAGRRPRRPARVRSRATVRHVDVLTVARVSVVFYLVVIVVFVVASLFLWLAADAFGTLPSIEKSVRSLFSLKSFRLHPGTVALYTAAAGVVIAVAGTLWNILLALVYNLIADVVGGVRVELESFTKE